MADDRPAPDLYDEDFYAWTQLQAQALRSNDHGSNIIDWRRIAEEIEDLGSEQRNAVRSHLIQILIHLHKLQTSRARNPRNHWRGEVRNHRLEIDVRMTQTIRNAVEADLAALHAKAAKEAQKALDEDEIGLSVDPSRSWTLAELLGEEADPLDQLR